MTVKVKHNQVLYFLFLNSKYKNNIFNYSLKNLFKKIEHLFCLKNVLYSLFKKRKENAFATPIYYTT